MDWPDDDGRSILVFRNRNDHGLRSPPGPCLGPGLQAVRDPARGDEIDRSTRQRPAVMGDRDGRYTVATTVTNKGTGRRAFGGLIRRLGNKS
jgi:hypothetical protein